MRTVNTVDLGVSLYLFGCEIEEIGHYVKCEEDTEKYIWYQFTQVDLEKILGYVQRCKNERVKIAVDDFYKVEHYISALKKMCSEKKRGMRGRR